MVAHYIKYKYTFTGRQNPEKYSIEMSSSSKSGSFILSSINPSLGKIIIIRALK